MNRIENLNGDEIENKLKKIGKRKKFWKYEQNWKYGQSWKMFKIEKRTMFWKLKIWTKMDTIGEIVQHRMNHINWN